MLPTANWSDSDCALGVRDSSPTAARLSLSLKVDCDAILTGGLWFRHQTPSLESATLASTAQRVRLNVPPIIDIYPHRQRPYNMSVAKTRRSEIVTDATPMWICSTRSRSVVPHGP